MILLTNPGSVPSLEIAYNACAKALGLDPLYGAASASIIIVLMVLGTLCNDGVATLINDLESGNNLVNFFSNDFGIVAETKIKSSNFGK
ncbi:hypothetical protein K4I79_005123 [Candida tropicalis]